MKTIQAIFSKLTPLTGARTQFHLIAMAILFGVLLLLILAVMLLCVPQVGFAHLACKMSEDTLGSAFSHARAIVKTIQMSSGILSKDAAGAPRLDIPVLRMNLHALAEEDPGILYSMVVSKSGRIFAHTHENTEGGQAWETTEAATPLLGTFGEFPGGRFDFDEFVYEIRVPFDADDWRDFVLVLGLSKARISDHIEEVRWEMGMRMMLAAVIGSVALAVPTAGLLFVLRRYRLLSRRSRQVEHLAHMGEIAKGLAHEIRNPLNAVRFNLKIIEEETDHYPLEMRDGYRQLIQRAAREVTRVDEMLTEYLNYVRPCRAKLSPHDVNAIMEDVLDFLGCECQRRGIELQRSLSSSLPKAMVDERQIRQAFMNVVLNAQQLLRHKGGHIIVRSSLKGGMLVIEVDDDGPGVPEEDWKKIFEPFFSKRDGGTGLGLAIAQRVMEDHGGMIECRGKHGHGAVFAMTLPLAKTADRPEEDES